MTKPRVADRASKPKVNLGDYTNFVVIINTGEAQYTYLPCRNYDDASKLFRTLLLTYNHHQLIMLKANKILGHNKQDDTISVSGPICLLKAVIQWNFEGTNSAENRVWTLLEDHLGWADMWHLLDGRS